MRRFRSTWPMDEGRSPDGDGAFLGVNMQDQPDKLPAGWLSAAKNALVEDGEVRTRKGCWSAPWANELRADLPATFEPVRGQWNAAVAYDAGDEVLDIDPYYNYYVTPGGTTAGEEPGEAGDWTLDTTGLDHMVFFDDYSQATIYGAGRYRGDGGKEYLCVLFETYMLACRQFEPPHRVGYPDPTIGASVEEAHLVQAYDRLVMYRGEGYGAWYWDGDTSGAFKTVASLPTPGAPDDPLPDAGEGAVFHGDRLWVPHGRDLVAVSDITNQFFYDAATRLEKVNAGADDRLVGLYSFGRDVLCFKRYSIERFADAYGDLSDMKLSAVSRNVGCIAYYSVAGWGEFLAWLADDGVWSLAQADEAGDFRPTVAEKPLSYPITPLIERVNWAKASGAQAAVWDGYYYLAVPLNDPDTSAAQTDNNAILVYNINRGAWQGHWEGPAADPWKVRRFVPGLVNGRREMFFWDGDGHLVLMNDGEQDDLAGTVHEISTSWTTRGYNPDKAERCRGLRVLANVGTSDPSATYTVVADGAFEETAAAGSPVTRDRLKFLYPAGARHDPTDPANDPSQEGREDYSLELPGPSSWVHLTSAGADLSRLQDFEEVFDVRREGRFIQLRTENTQGRLAMRQCRLETRAGRRDSRPKV